MDYKEIDVELIKLHKKYIIKKNGYDKTSLLSYLCSPIASLDMILSFRKQRRPDCVDVNKSIYLTFKQLTNSPFIKV